MSNSGKPVEADASPRTKPSGVPISPILSISMLMTQLIALIQLLISLASETPAEASRSLSHQSRCVRLLPCCAYLGRRARTGYPNLSLWSKRDVSALSPPLGPKPPTTKPSAKGANRAEGNAPSANSKGKPVGGVKRMRPEKKSRGSN